MTITKANASQIVYARASLASTSVESKLSEQISVKDFGAVGDGVADDTAAIQAALSSQYRVIHFPSVANSYRVTSTLYVQGSKVLIGEGTIPMTSYQNSRSAGSWLYFDHLSVGLRFGDADASGLYTGSEVISMGSVRNQPVAAGIGWEPLNNDYDIDIVNSDVTIKNYHLYNATYGIRLRNGGTGRLNIHTLRGFPAKIGIQIYEQYDLCRIENVHFWPFYGIQNEGVWNYTINNSQAIHLLRVDNPFLTNIFTIFYKDGVLISQHPTAGTANKVKIINGDFDRGRHGIRIAADGHNHVGQYVNISAQAESPGDQSGAYAGITGSDGAGLTVLANNCSITMSNVDFREHRSNAVRVEGIGNRVSISQLKVDNPDTSETGFPAIEAASGNTIEILGIPQLTNLGVGGKYSPTGNLLVDDWRNFTPVVTQISGTIAQLGQIDARYKVVANTVYVTFYISIVSNGTGAEAVRFPIPFGQALFPQVGIGREVMIDGKQLVVVVDQANSFINIYNYDNSYPAAIDGSMLMGTVSYQI